MWVGLVKKKKNIEYLSMTELVVMETEKLEDETTN